jgi:hypothetical protein
LSRSYLSYYDTFEVRSALIYIKIDRVKEILIFVDIN